MNAVLKIFLSMSFSGGLLILVLLLGKRFWKDKISRQWQYYIWLVIVLRLLLPFGLETTLFGKTYQSIDQAMAQAQPFLQKSLLPNASGDGFASDEGNGPDNEKENSLAEDLETVQPLQDIGAMLTEHIWVVWLMAALGLLIRKVTIYQSFIRYINAALAPVSDLESLDRLCAIAQRAGMKRPVELCVNPLISSPLLIGFFHPCIVLPSADIAKKDFDYIALHELTHCKRGDMFYKWLVQVTVCLHWFNPLVHLMSREIAKACEFSCDEAVLAKMGRDNAQDYGKTLLDAMAAVGKYKEELGTVTLSENKRLLKERLGAIMGFKTQSKTVKLLTVALTLCMAFGASFIGVYSVAAAADGANAMNGEKLTQLPPDDLPSDMADNPAEMETLDMKGTTYYLVHNEAQLRAIGTGEYGMVQNYMQQADIWLSGDEWKPIGTWDNPFTGVFNGNGFEIIGLTMADPEAELVGLFGVAENAHIYNITMRDCDIASAGRNAANKSVGAILAIGRWVRSYDNFVYSKETEENKEDENLALQPFLSHALGREDELDKLEEQKEKEWEEAHIANYRAVGVTMDGKNYYYQGELVHIFLDVVQPDKAFYTLSINPKGAVNIKIVRDGDNTITGVAYMTEEEVTELFNDMGDEEDWDDPEEVWD